MRARAGDKRNAFEAENSLVHSPRREDGLPGMSSGLRSGNHEAETGIRVLVSLACVVVIVAGLKTASDILVPIALGLFLGVLSFPILQFFHLRCRIPRIIAVGLTILIDLLLLGAIVYVVSGVIPEFQDKRVEYAEKVREQAVHFSESVDQFLLRYGNLGQYIGIEGDPEMQTIPTFREMFNRYWDTNRFVELIGQTAVVERFTSVVSKSFFVLILMVFVLAEAQRYEEKARDVIRDRGPNLRRFRTSARDIQNYLLLKTAVSALTGFLAWLVCAAVGIDFPLLWGILAFLLNFIPVIGSFVAAIPPIGLALILQGFWPAVIVMVLYLAINGLIGNFLEPMLLGDRFNLSTIVVILSVLFWGFIWGPAGMFLAVPLTMMVKVMLDNTPEMRWLSVMISKGGMERQKRLRRWEKVRREARRRLRRDEVEESSGEGAVDGGG